MIPGEIFLAEQEIVVNEDSEAFTISIFNGGDRPIQVGSHYHFYITNKALEFERDRTYECRLDIASGTAVRFEPGQSRVVSLIKFSATRNEQSNRDQDYRSSKES